MANNLLARLDPRTIDGLRRRLRSRKEALRLPWQPRDRIRSKPCF
jgi:hypothetical protein